MAALIASIPLQLVCQLVVTGSSDETIKNWTNSDASPTQSVPIAIPEGYVTYPTIGVAYKVHNDSVKWNAARKLCEAEGGNLAVIDSWQKFNYLSGQRKSNGLTHVGIHDLYDDAEWVSVKNGSPLSFIPWATGEPTLNGGGHCVMVKSQSGGLGNYGCGNFRGDFVCEISIKGDRTVTRSIPN